MRKTTGVLALGLLALASPARADHFYVSIETLHGWCQPNQIDSDSIGSLCEGYLNAIADILADGLPIHESRACIPEQPKWIAENRRPAC